jgi:CHAT domain-containing protein
VIAPSWLTLRTITPALALTAGAVVALLLLVLGFAPAGALACAVVSAAGTAAWVGGNVRAMRSTYALGAGQQVLLIAAETAGLLAPVAALLSRFATTALLVPLIAVAAAALAINTARSMRAAELHRLTAGSVGARTIRQAAHIARKCEQLLARGLEDPARAFAELNRADALAESMPAQDTQQVMDLALGLLRRIEHDPALDPGFAVMAAATVMKIGNAHAAITGDLDTYEAAVGEAEAIVRRSAEYRDITLASLLKQRADLLHARGGSALAAAVAGAPHMRERCLVSFAQALELLDAAARASARDNSELHFARAGILSELATLEDDAGTHDRAVAEIRVARRLARQESVLQRGMVAVLAAVVFTAAVDAGAGPALLDEALDQIRPVLRHRLDKELRARLLIQRAELQAMRNGSWDARLVSDYRRGFELMNGSPFGSVGSAAGWAHAAAAAGLTAEAAEAYLRGLGVVADLVSTRLIRRFRTGPLREGRGLAAEAAFWLVKQGRPDDAAVALETGRAISATQVIQRESVAVELRRGGHQALADQYAGAIRRLSALERDDAGSLSYLSAQSQRQARELEAAQRDYLGLRAQIQAIGGFRDTFRVVTFSDITDATRERPVVYVTAAERGGVAVLVDGSRSREIALPGLSVARLTIQVQEYRAGLFGLRENEAPQWRLRLSEMLAWLTEATRPLWTALASFDSVTMVPAGPLALLPLHAAQDGGGLAIAFAPNARIVASLSGRQPGPAPLRVLVVDNSAPEWEMTNAEIAAVRASAERVRVLSGADAARDCVLAELPYWNAYHFTCHGRADDVDPLAGGLLLRDGLLTVGDILASRVQNAQLAVLSACETSIPHSDLLDEVVGLPVALMEAGIPGVIGALWEVEPRASVLLVRRFYQRRDAGMHPAVALQQAQAWLRQVTNEELAALGDVAAPGRRLTGAAASTWGSVRPYEHPDAWAGFTYTGI